LESQRASRRWPYLLGILAGLVAGLILFISLRVRNIEDRTRGWVVSELEERFHSEVQLDELHVSLVPSMGVTGEGLAIRYHNRSDLPPMFRVQRFSFNLGVLGILRAPRHIAGIYVENMIITVPPRGENKANSPDQERQHRTVPNVIVDEIVINDTDLVIIPRKQGKDPLDWDIHDLVLKSVGANKPFDFRGNLTNGKPVGEIATTGEFGPWDADEPGDSPVSGVYKFTNADLGPFPGIAGILSSTGKYNGRLNEIQVEGETDTPDFSLDKVGNPVPLHTKYAATVDGTNGDTYLHPVNATLGHSLIVANGSVVKSKEKKGHYITLDVVSQKARLEDILRLATKSDKPFMTGVLNLKTKFLQPPGAVKILDKLKLDGEFDVTDGRWASAEVRDKLESFSRHAEGKPNDQEAGSSIADLRGHFRLDDGVITFKDLSFSVPGAAILLRGTYNLRGEDLNFNGQLRMKAHISQTVRGAKSFFLKAVDPFFAKNGAGAVIPISITGKRNAPSVGFTVFHRKIERKIGDQGDKNDKSKDSKDADKQHGNAKQ
jgi:AsmA-like C-terminal region